MCSQIAFLNTHVTNGLLLLPYVLIDLRSQTKKNEGWPRDATFIQGSLSASDCPLPRDLGWMPHQCVTKTLPHNNTVCQ